MKAFGNCTALNTVKFSPNLIFIDKQAFYGCRSITEMNIPDSVASVGAEAFEGCTAIQSVKIGQLVTEIPEGMFENCTRLKSVFIFGNIVHIGEDAFANCVSLQKINLPSTVADISGTDTFKNCPVLTVYTQNLTYAYQYARVNDIKTYILPSFIGDINIDGKCNLKDVSAIQGYLSEKISLSQSQQVLADVNGDGTISLSDTFYLQNKISN